MTTKTTKAHAETFTWDREPVVGEYVGGWGLGTWKNAKSSRVEGIYEGIRPSDWDGQPTHYFRDGIMGVTPQGLCGFPVGVDGLVETRTIR